MKKMIVYIILVLLPFVLIACADNNEVIPNALNELDQNDISIPALGSEELTLGDFTILEGLHGFPGDRLGTLSIEEAAHIGAIYILDVFYNTLEGMYLEMTFNYNPHISESLWIGTIAHSPDSFGGAYEGFIPGIIMFSIDAFTGERVNISNEGLESLHILDLPPWELSEAEFLELYPKIDDDEMEIMVEVATDYASRHFGDSSTVESINFVDESNPNEFLNFTAMDNNGRVVDILIQRETRKLYSISSPLDF